MDHKFAKLLGALIDGQIDAIDEQELQQLLSSKEAEDEFLRLMQLHFNLAEREAPVRAFSGPELRAVTEAEVKFNDTADLKYENKVNDSASIDAKQNQLPAPKAPSRWLSFVGGIAASLLFILPFAYLLLNGSKASLPEVAMQDQATNLDLTTKGAAARIVKKIDCIWENDRWMVKAPSDFREGEGIRLSRGLLVLEFASGAQVTLQGPADATPISDNGLKLNSGGLTASVPEEAKGFAVYTSSGEVIDLGTEFGVYAGEDGSVETHVFKGEVISRVGIADGSEEPGESLTEGQAQYVSSSGTMRKAAAVESRFLRSGFDLDQELPNYHPIDRGLILWLAADGRLQLDNNDRVMAWGDNPTRVNQKIEDTWQVNTKARPLWNENAIHGQPGILFGKNVVLVSEPIEIASDFTTSIVFRLNPDKVSQAFDNLRTKHKRRHEARPDLGLQLLNFFGPPHPVIQIQEDLSLLARVHLGWDPDHIYDNDVGVNSSNTIIDDSPHIIVYTYNASLQTSSLYLDGVKVSETHDVINLDSAYTPCYFGNHPYRAFHGFPGYIGEIMLHEVSLNQSEVGELTEWLGQKYDIMVDTPK